MKLPFSTGCLRLFSESSVYLKAHRRLTREAMHMLHMRIIMDIIAVFFMVLSPLPGDVGIIPYSQPVCQPFSFYCRLFFRCFRKSSARPVSST